MYMSVYSTKLPAPSVQGTRLVIIHVCGVHLVLNPLFLITTNERSTLLLSSSLWKVSYFMMQFCRIMSYLLSYPKLLASGLNPHV